MERACWHRFSDRTNLTSEIGTSSARGDHAGKYKDVGGQDHDADVGARRRGKHRHSRRRYRPEHAHVLRPIRTRHQERFYHVAGQLHMTSAMRHASDGPWATLPAATESHCCTRAASKRASSIVDLSSSASANAPLRLQVFRSNNSELRPGHTVA